MNKKFIEKIITDLSLNKDEVELKLSFILLVIAVFSFLAPFLNDSCRYQLINIAIFSFFSFVGSIHTLKYGLLDLKLTILTIILHIISILTRAIIVLSIPDVSNESMVVIISYVIYIFMSTIIIFGMIYMAISYVIFYCTWNKNEPKKCLV